MRIIYLSSLRLVTVTWSVMSSFISQVSHKWVINSPITTTGLHCLWTRWSNTFNQVSWLFTQGSSGVCERLSRTGMRHAGYISAFNNTFRALISHLEPKIYTELGLNMETLWQACFSVKWQQQWISINISNYHSRKRKNVSMYLSMF